MTKSTGVGRGKGGGAPSKFKPDFCRIARDMAGLGATDREIAHAIGISERVFYEWAHRHPKFQQAIKLGKVHPNERAERSLYTRATGYSYDAEEVYLVDHIREVPSKDPDEKPTIIRTKKVLRVPVVKHVPPDATSLIFFLKNRKKDQWRDFKATELSTPPGRPLEFASAAGESELIGQYLTRVGRAAPAPHSPALPDPSADRGVGEERQGAQGSRSRKGPDKG